MNKIFSLSIFNEISSRSGKLSGSVKYTILGSGFLIGGGSGRGPGAGAAGIAAGGAGGPPRLQEMSVSDRSSSGSSSKVVSSTI